MPDLLPPTRARTPDVTAAVQSATPPAAADFKSKSRNERYSQCAWQSESMWVRVSALSWRGAFRTNVTRFSPPANSPLKVKLRPAADPRCANRPLQLRRIPTAWWMRGASRGGFGKQAASWVLAYLGALMSEPSSSCPLKNEAGTGRGVILACLWSSSGTSPSTSLIKAKFPRV